MTDSPPWPRIGDADQWTYVRARLEHDAGDQGNSAVTFEIWARYPAVVLRESVDGRLLREVRANGGESAALDVERGLCLAKTGQDGEAYDAAVAIAVGPVAELYGAASLEGWRQETVRNTVAYYNERGGTLRQATIDSKTGLPLEADTVDGRWRWVTEVVGSDPPSAAPDVTDWPKESHERTELPIDDAPVEDIRYRSSSLGKPLEFIAFDEAESSARVVIAPYAANEGEQPKLEHLNLPDGRTATVIAGEPLAAQRLIEQVTKGLGVDPAAPYTAEEAGQWNRRINDMVSKIVPGGSAWPGPRPKPKPKPWRPPTILLAAIAIVGVLAIPAVAVTLGIWPPAPTFSPAPATPSAEASIVPALGATLDYETFYVLRSGDWTGSAIVTPTGGSAPYAIESNGELRPNAQGAERFEIGNSGCAPVDVMATVRSQDGQSQNASGSYRPDRCAEFAVPPAPGVGDPPDEYELRSNCTSTPLALGGSPAGEPPPGSTWTFEVESRIDANWTPMHSVSDLREPLFRADFPCATVYRWRLATVSPDAWQSEFSPWSTFTIRPTAIPALDPTVYPCSHPWPALTWTVDSKDGIARYVVEIVDLQDAPIKVNVDGPAAYGGDGACGSEYRWRGASVDSDGNRGAFSEWTPFTIQAEPIF
jgi:hypothetical protein